MSETMPQAGSHPALLSGSDPASILTVASILVGGGVAVIPTDTVYGLSAGAFRGAAVERVFAIKQRPAEKRVPILLATAADLSLLVSDVPEPAWSLISHFWPGPLTLVLPARPSVPHAITQGGGTVAVRVPSGRTCLQLLETVGEPLVGTSANVAGRPPAGTGAAALRDLGGAVDAILVDDAAVGGGPPSTVVELTDRECVVHRKGGVTVDDLRRVLGMRVTVLR
jgi:L-threonylcarbamoyladenylate synthase